VANLKIGSLWSAAVRMFDVLVEAARLFSNKRADLLAGGLAFHVLISLAPLLLVSVAATSLFLDVDDANAAWRRTIAQMLGSRAAELSVEWMRVAREYAGEATGVGLVLFLLGSSRLYVGLRASVCAIFDVKPPHAERMRDWLRQLVGTRVKGALVALGAGLAIGAAVVAEMLVGWLIESYLPPSVPRELVQVGRVLVSFAVLCAIFAALFRIVPGRTVEPRHAILGGIVTATLLLVMNAALDLYFAKSESFEVYGAAGSVVVVLVWLVFSSEVVLFGAAVTRVSMTSSEAVTRETRLEELAARLVDAQRPTPFRPR
jgi:membrane protein